MNARPNIVFITCHDLGKHLNCYGWNTVNSPNIDRLAGEGVIFDNNFCTAPQCSPSRAALHTGRHAHTVGMLGLAHHDFAWSLHPDEVHMAKRLRDSGYHTALMGIQHVAAGLTQPEHPTELGYTVTTPLDTATIMGKHAADFIRTQSKGEPPFYLEVGFVEPHRPFQRDDAPPDVEKGVELPPYIPEIPEAHEEFAALQGSIKALDTGVGMILQAIDNAGIRENTWVIFITDHGLAMPRAKGTLYDPGIETALIMRWPAAGIMGGRRLDALTSHVDVVPTMVELLQLSPPDNLHGRSYAPLLRSQTFAANPMIFAEKTFHNSYDPMRCVRTNTHKLIVNFETGIGVDVPSDTNDGPLYGAMRHELVHADHPHIELYDLHDDPQERENLAGQPQLVDLQAELLGHLAAWMRDTGDPLLQGPVVSPFYRKSRALLDV